MIDLLSHDSEWILTDLHLYQPFLRFRQLIWINLWLLNTDRFIVNFNGRLILLLPKILINVAVIDWKFNLTDDSVLIHQVSVGLERITHAMIGYFLNKTELLVIRQHHGLNLIKIACFFGVILALVQQWYRNGLQDCFHWQKAHQFWLNNCLKGHECISAFLVHE